MIKILAIGNSFSQDATAFIEVLDDNFFVRNLYIGGCSLERHANLCLSGEREYEYQHNGQAVSQDKVCLKQALTAEPWDFVTVQQASGFSGVEESYYPHLTTLLNYVKKYSNAKILFHQTWSYEKYADHPDFARYGNDSEKMWKRIEKVSKTVCERENLPIIPCGELIARLKKQPYFDLDKGGISIHADGYHLSKNYGRMATAGLWIKYFTGKIPPYFYREDLSLGYKLILTQLEKK